MMVDYSSVLGREDKRKRFSEELEDTELKDSLELQKLYRKIQRQVHYVQEETEVRPVSMKNVYSRFQQSIVSLMWRYQLFPSHKYQTNTDTNF